MRSLLAWTVVVALGLTGSAVGGKKARNWQTGKLLDSQRSQNLVGAVEHPAVGLDNRRRTRNVYETHDSFVIETDTYTYTVSEIVRGTKPANVTVNGQVKFAVEGTTLYLVDDGGKEHRTDVVKKVLHQASEQPK
jgi:hypothetical protein